MPVLHWGEMVIGICLWPLGLSETRTEHKGETPAYGTVRPPQSSSKSTGQEND